MRRFALEGAVIVGSILLAFGIDAWWDGRQDRAAETELIRDLHAEVQFNLERLDEFDSPILRARAAISELQEMAGPNAQPVDAIVIDSLLFTSIGNRTYDPPSGAIEAILQGGLGVLRSPDLRREIAKWEEQRRDFKEDEGFDEVEFLDHFWPYLRTRALIFTPDRAASASFGAPRHLMLRELEFSNLLGMRSGRLRLLAEESRDFRDYLETLLELTAP